MKIGMNLPVMVPGLDRDTVIEWCRRIDSGPYSSLAAGERITFPNPEIMVTMSVAAGITERVRLFFSVCVLPMHSPTLIAKQVATLDVLSGGRVSLGVGVGAREEDFRAVGARYGGGLLGRLERGVAEMRRAWAGEPPFEGAARPVEPAPLQPGGPEVLAGSLASQSIERAAVWADGICGFSFNPSIDDIAPKFELARQAWQRAGRSEPPRLVTGFWFALGRNARTQIDEYLERYLCFIGPGAGHALAENIPTVSESALRQAIRNSADAGADELLLVPTTADPDEVDRVADLIG